MTTIKLDDIHLYENNPRLPESNDEGEALLKLVDDQQDKLSHLADDIVEY